jgi:hypothetical protein
MSGDSQREQEQSGTDRPGPDSSTRKKPTEMSSLEHFLTDYSVVPAPGARTPAR